MIEYFRNFLEPSLVAHAEITLILQIFSREHVLQAIHNHHQTHSGGLGVSTVLDVGCSTGDSTRALADWFPSAHITVST